MRRDLRGAQDSPAFAELVGDQPALLVVDGVPDTSEPRFDRIARLLHDCPQLRVLITAERPCGIPGGRRLAPLGGPGRTARAGRSAWPSPSACSSTRRGGSGSPRPSGAGGPDTAALVRPVAERICHAGCRSRSSSASQGLARSANVMPAASPHPPHRQAGYIVVASATTVTAAKPPIPQVSHRNTP